MLSAGRSGSMLPNGFNNRKAAQGRRVCGEQERYWGTSADEGAAYKMLARRGRGAEGDSPEL